MGVSQVGVVVLMLLSIMGCRAQDPRVILDHGGIIEGQVKTSNLGDSVQFLGVPYGAAPVGPLRFKLPKKHMGWEGVMETKEYGAACMQDSSWTAFYPPDSPYLPKSFSEDCLTLNVDIPGNALDLDRADPLAVMVWIHGGGLLQGNTRLYPGHSLAASENVIVVSVNYRLSVFGFLASGDSQVPGNMGLWDQNLALKWVQMNIAKFGGDPDKVTIFGESAGGWSVSLHMMSPVSRGLFTRAVSQSGVYLFHLLEPEEVQGHFQYFAGNMSCTDEILDCLQSADAVELISQYGPGYIPNGGVLVVDGAAGFIPSQPTTIFEDQNLPAVDFMVGIMKDEADVILDSLGGSFYNFIPDGMNQFTALFYMSLIGSLAARNYHPHPETVQFGLATRIVDQYLEKPSDNISNLENTMDAMADYFFFAPSVKSARVMSTIGQQTNRNAYFFHLTHKGPATPTLPIDAGPFHGEDTGYLFGDYVDSGAPEYGQADEDDRLVSRSMMRAWASFAKEG